MQIQQMVKDVMKNHTHKIELFQWAVINAVSSLIYSEYLRCMRNKMVPVRMVIVPSLKSVRDLLKSDGPFMEKLSTRLIDDLVKNNTFRKLTGAPELVIFSDEYIEVTKTIFDLYIIPNMGARIPEAIGLKFGLGVNGAERNQMFREEDEQPMFDGKNPFETPGIYNYIVEEAALCLANTIPSAINETIFPEQNRRILLSDVSNLTIKHDNAICPIIINREIIMLRNVIGLLKFVTNTEITAVSTHPMDESYEVRIPDTYGDGALYIIDTNPFNQTCLTKFTSINPLLYEEKPVKEEAIEGGG